MVERSPRSRPCTSPWLEALPAELAGLGLTIAEVSAIIGLEPECSIVPSSARDGDAPTWRAVRAVRLAELLATVRVMLGRDGAGWFRAPNPALGHRSGS